MSLVEVLQDDGDVHVDDDHEVDDDERDEVDDGHEGVAAVAVGQVLEVDVAIRGSHEEWLQNVVPPCWRHKPEKDGTDLKKASKAKGKYLSR